MKRSTTNILLFAILLTLLSGVAFADGGRDSNRLLRGDYRLHSTESCVGSANGFGPPPIFASIGNGDHTDSISNGLISFDGDGNAVATYKTMTVIDDRVNNPTNFWISAAHTTCDYTYTVKPDRTFAMRRVICKGDIVAGPGAGLGLEITRGGESEGFIGLFRETLLETSVEPIQEELTLFFQGNPLQPVPRLCTRSTTYLRVPRNR
jgi:hypothetical protein